MKLARLGRHYRMVRDAVGRVQITIDAVMVESFEMLGQIRTGVVIWLESKY